jgi:serine-type D-Ala-D-Ala carboxypeptidase/endopeptidase (penicillin-binding protein 4)
MMRQFSLAVGAFVTVLWLCCCTTPQKLTAKAARTLLQDTALQQAHIGISLYNTATGQYIYNHQADKYFIPASNTKLFSCYAGMKYLGDSLVGLQYAEDDTALWLLPTGDPTLLHPDFLRHPVLDFLQRQQKQPYLLPGGWKEEALGYGWAWDDYNGEYMVERSPLPVHGNMALYRLQGMDYLSDKVARPRWEVSPPYFATQLDMEMALPGTLAAQLRNGTALRQQLQRFSLLRQRMGNRLLVEFGRDSFARAEIPVYTDTMNTALAVLRHGYLPGLKKGGWGVAQALKWAPGAINVFKQVKSQPTDSMLLPMMHRSDNFYAEQTLLMVAQQRLGYMNMAAIIDTLLRTDLKDLPQRPKWVDGSGLSRYNLASPQDFVVLLQKMKAEFGLERLKHILPTGGEGTISRYYQGLKGQIFAKTGTLSNNCALSGYLFTAKGHCLIFSVLANHYPSGATPVRRAVERFLNQVRQQY